jgi:S1-C subfamily serine protease
MWEVFEPAQQVMAAGFEPEMTLLRLFLPEGVTPYRLTEVAISDRADIAILRTDRPPEAGSPVTLGGEDSPRIGEPVIMLSYPGTVDTLLARVAQATSREILAKAGDDSVKLIDELALRKLIRPLATQGHISDVSPELITYEAVSASGSSGAPIFNSAGKVIGVNQAMLQRIGGVHVALPVRFVNELIGSAARGNPRAE